MLEGVLDGYSHNNKSGHPSFPFIPLKEESITVLSYFFVDRYASVYAHHTTNQEFS